MHRMVYFERYCKMYVLFDSVRIGQCVVKLRIVLSLIIAIIGFVVKYHEM